MSMIYTITIIMGHLENLSVRLEIDISTGDQVTPKELSYDYPMLFENKKIHIYSYNIETILSEKIETILRRGVYNSRMKDYYDVNMFLTRLVDEINIDDFKLAIANTFTKTGARIIPIIEITVAITDTVLIKLPSIIYALIEQINNITNNPLIIKRLFLFFNVNNK